MSWRNNRKTKADFRDAEMRFIDDVKNCVVNETEDRFDSRVYGFDGNVIDTADPTEGLAKQFRDGTGDHYFVKLSTRESHAGLLNPWGIYFNKGDEKRADISTKKPFYEYTKVSKECYETYLTFLNTRNPARLRAAERLLTL